MTSEPQANPSGWASITALAELKRPFAGMKSQLNEMRKGPINEEFSISTGSGFLDEAAA